MPFPFSRLSSFGNSATSTQDPFADQPPTGQDPFADQPPTGQDPFADQPQTGQDPFEDEANTQQLPKLRPQEIPAEPEEIVDEPEQAAVTGSSDTVATIEQNSETGVPVVQAQRKISPTSSFIPEFDYLYLLPLVIPVLLVWLWLRARKNQANKLQAYRQWQSPESLPTGPNIQCQPVWRPVQQEPSPGQSASDKTIISDNRARFRTGNPSREEIELSLDESGEELHIGNLSAIDEQDSEEFDFSAESDLGFETETVHQAAQTGSGPVADSPKRTTTAGSNATVSAEKPQFATTTENLQLPEPELDEMFAEGKEAAIARELDADLEDVQLDDPDDDLTPATDRLAPTKQALPAKLVSQMDDLHSVTDKFEREISRLNQLLLSTAHRDQELEAVRVQVTDFKEQIRSTNETWAKRLDEQIRLQQDLENRAAKAEAQLAKTVDKSVVAELENKLAAVQAELDAAHEQKESLAANISEMDAFAKLAENDATARIETAQVELTRAKEQAASQLTKAEEQASVQLAAIKSEYEAKLANIQSRSVETLEKADQKATAKLADARAEAAQKLAEVEAQAAVKISEAEKRFGEQVAVQLAEAQAKADKKLAEVKSEADTKVSEADKQFHDQLEKAKRKAAKKLADVESQAAEKVAEAEQNAAAQLAEQQAKADARIAEAEAQVAAKLAESPTKAEARIAEVESQAAVKIAEAEEQTATILAESQTKTDARIAEVELKAAEKLAEAEENAATKIADALSNVDAQIADVKAQAEEQVAAAEAAAKQSIAAAKASPQSTGAGTVSQGEVKPETVARIVRKYKKERARRIEIQEMLDEAEVHRSVLSNQIKDLQQQISSETKGSD